MSLKTSFIKSPLRYPGGKSKAIRQILPYLPQEFEEYREPFVGGGSLFLYLRQTRPGLECWINDLNKDLYMFWCCAKEHNQQLCDEVWRLKQKYSDGRKLFELLSKQRVEELSKLERAARFFVLNRITFSGTIEAGGYSQKAFESRFTASSIERLVPLGGLLEGVCITNLDYRDVLTPSEKKVFTFFDPPYLTATKSKLYGKKGALHTAFHHEDFAEALNHYSHDWLITYDNSEEIRTNFAFANIYEWELQYGMNNYKQDKAAKGKELFICSYPVYL
ncbi:MAG: DNA adenine methylase [Trueperaceae bacterium]